MKVIAWKIVGDDSLLFDRYLNMVKYMGVQWVIKRHKNIEMLFTEKELKI